MIDWKNVRKETSEYFSSTKYLKDLAGVTVLNGAILSLVFGVIDPYISKHSIVPTKEIPRFIDIDRDNLADLVVGNKIFLADQTEEGVKFRQLNNSDSYRITK